MSKRFLAVFGPLIAVIAFAVVPAIAQAQTRQYGTETGGVFTAFTKATAVTDKKVSTTFVLASEDKTAGITCTSFSSSGTDENVTKGTEKVGVSKDKLTFDGCTGTGELAACSINPLTNHEISGEVSNEVLTGGEKVEIKVVSGFNVKCGTTELGNVTGSAVGSQAKKGNVLKFKEAKGLLFAGKKSTITGEASTVTTTGSKPVVIN